ncbi:MAG: type III pantothenate kinase [Proteobacteria bacterium]|nr:type III pantothenate kinase [Pseudomonadota bacterium]
MNDYLVIDVGNTRLKWGWLSDARLSKQQAVVHREVDAESWSKGVFDAAHRPERVLVSNVAGEAMAWNLHRFSQETYGLEPEFIKPTRSFHELTNGYLNPTLLGADRWLAVIGAWNLAHGPLCVVDAGTAVKVDSVNAHGQHLGGLIVPGIHMMRESLLNKTHGVAPAMANSASSSSAAGVLANNTIAAVTRGAVVATAAMADRAAQLVERSTGEHPQMFITGGDAELIMESMQWPGKLVPDLVLQGIAVLAMQND